MFHMKKSNDKLGYRKASMLSKITAIMLSVSIFSGILPHELIGTSISAFAYDSITEADLQSSSEELSIGDSAITRINYWDGSVATSYAGGSGTESSPYLIENGAQLALMSQQVNNQVNNKAYFKLTDNIYLNRVSNYDNWENEPPANEWTPIGHGNDTESVMYNACKESFYGSFDGNGYTIVGLYVNTAEKCAGLFGHTSTSTIKNVNLFKSYVNGADYVGSIVGYNEGWLTMNNCSSSGMVKGNNNVGGLIGCIYTGADIKYASNDCNVLGSLYVGGILGKSSCASGDVSILYCCNSGSINGNESVAGICGHVSNGSTYGSTISNCYNSGIISGVTSNYGGIIGHLEPRRTVSNCYNAGSITSAPDENGSLNSDANYGAIVGNREVMSSVSDCFYLDTSCDKCYFSSWYGTSTTGACSDAKMQLQSTFTSFDFDKIWCFDYDSEYKYPQILMPENSDTVYIKPDKSLIEKVDTYCQSCEDLSERMKQIDDSDISEEERIRLIQDLFTFYGITDITEGMDYCHTIYENSSNTEKLLYNDLYVSHIFTQTLEEHPEERAILVLGGLILQGEYKDYINFFEIQQNLLTGKAAWDDFPSIKKYEAMLLDYMNYSKPTWTLVNVAKNINTICGKVTTDAKTSLLATLESLPADKLPDALNELKSEGIYYDLEINSTTGKRVIKLDSESGFGKFAKAMGMANQIISFFVDTADDLNAIIDLDNKISLYFEYIDFLTEINENESYPWDLRLAAKHLIDEYEQNYFGAYEEFITNIVVEGAKMAAEFSGVDFNILKILADQSGLVGDFFSSVNEILVVVDLTSWALKFVANYANVLDKATYLEGYECLCQEYSSRLIEARNAFNSNKCYDNALRFYECYEKLRTLRIKAEETYLNMCDIQGAIGDTINALTGFNKKEALVVNNIRMLEKANFSQVLPDGFVPSAKKLYTMKSIITCPVNVTVKSPDGEVIAELIDGQEVDIENEWGRFICIYRPTTEDYTKVLYFEDDSCIVEMTAVDDGLVSYSTTRSGIHSFYSFNNIIIHPNDVIKVSNDNQDSAIIIDSVSGESTDIAISGISLDNRILIDNLSIPDTIGLNIGEVAVVPVVVNPINATNQSLIWYSTDESVAEVKNGVIYAVGEGQTTIFAVACDNSNLKAECVVNVNMPKVVTPNILPDGGSFSNSQEVTITCDTEGAEIYYTIDGSEPTVESARYTVPFTVRTTTTIKAFAVKNGMTDSEVACAEYVCVAPFKITGHSLLLGDDIGVNFYIDIIDDIAKDSTAELRFTVNGRDTVIPVSNAKLTDNGYKFTCTVAAAEMNDVIKAQLYVDGQTVGSEFTYSVKTYADYILAHSADYSAEVPLVSAMLNYGAAAEKYFREQTDMSFIKPVIPAGELEQYKYILLDNDSEIDFVGQVISLENKVTAKLYFSGKDFAVGDFTVTQNGVAVNASRLSISSDDNGTYLAISGICANEMSNTFKITVGGVTIRNYSVFSYVRGAIDNETEALSDVVAALYVYGCSAEEYTKSIV